jgi:hypothetical protein
LLAVADLDHGDDKNLIDDLINRTVVLAWADGNAVELFGGHERFSAGRPRIVFEAQDIAFDVLADMRIEAAEVAFGSGSEVDAVSQAGSVSEFAHEVAEGLGAFAFGFLQGAAGVFDILAVYFLFGEAFEEAQVFDGDDGGEVFAAPGDDDAFVGVGRAVNEFGELVARLGDVYAGLCGLCHSY